MIEIPFTEVTVKEAVHLMSQNSGYVDGDKQAVIIDEEEK